jgi:apolipoprotein N-acyltransferase
MNKLKILLIPLLFSIPIYFEYFGIGSNLLNTICGIFIIYFLFTTDKKSMFYIGTFVGILLFYWISISFIYYGFWYLIPFGILGVGVIYGLFFYFIGFFQNYFYRLLSIISIEFIHPLGFNWFNFDLFFANSYIIDCHYLIFLLFLFLTLKQNFKFIPFLFLPFILYIPKQKPNDLNLDIKLVTTNISQDQKWKQNSAKTSFEIVKREIESAIKENRQIIVLPESSIEAYLNQQPYIMQYLKAQSHKISIVLGSIKYDNNQIFNSNYIFQKGLVTIANKVVPVPIGEKIPLPQFLVDFINDVFYDGAVDYSSANDVTDYYLHDIKFRNAICFEATVKDLYKNNPKYLIANSNNAWFSPSIQPIMQKLLLQGLSNRYGTTIFHSCNGSSSYIITPKK